MKDRWIIALLTLIGLGFMLAFVWSQRAWLEEGGNDFAAFYSGAALLGEENLYDVEALWANETRFLGDYAKTHGYVRLPFHAVFLWPLTRLPYMTAFIVWETLIALAFVGFVLLWRPPDLPLVALFSAMSLPAFSVFVTGQDDTFLLLAIAVTMALHRKGREVLAGAVFSLCAAKFHLFFLTPVLILGQRAWGFAKGMLLGGAGLAAISFVAAGPSWPAEFIRSATDPRFTPSAENMPNLQGLFWGAPNAALWEGLLAVFVAVVCWVAARRMPFAYAFAVSLLGGVLLSRHCYLADASMWLPAALTLLCMSRFTPVKAVSAALLIPVTYFLGVTEGVTSGAVVAALGLLGLIAWEALRASKTCESHQPWTGSPLTVDRKSAA